MRNNIIFIRCISTSLSLQKSKIMSSYDYYSTTESETDEEYEQELEQLEEEMIRDREGVFLCEMMHKNNIHSPLNGPMDGDMLNDCLHPTLEKKMLGAGEYGLVTKIKICIKRDYFTRVP